MSNYNKYFLRRFAEYRRHLGMTQEEAAVIFDVTQSQFSKMERGETIISHARLKRLFNAEWDVDFLVTGERSARGQDASELNILIQQAPKQYKAQLLETSTLLLKQGISKCAPDLSFESQCELEILKMRAECEGADFVMWKIRETTGSSQISMAEELGVGVRKYRKLEKNVDDPDAELLSHIYELTGCRPSLFLNYDHLDEMIIDHLWGQMTPPVQDKVLGLVKRTLELMQM